jgi:hypothetical protein
MIRLRGFATVLVVLLMVAGTAWGAGGDAGSGQDAGGSRSAGLPIEYGSYSARLAPDDRDWYRAPGVGTPACIEASIYPATYGVSATLGYERGASAELVNQFAPAGVTTTLAVAGSGWTAGILGVETTANKNANGVSARPTDYSFSLRPVMFSSRLSGDALTGADASGSLSEATRVSAGCLAGHLDPLAVGEGVDAYSVTAAAGTFITYTLAAASDAPIQLNIYDAQQKLVGTIGPDGQFSLPVSTDGSYTFTTSSSSLSVADIPYLVGIVIGPPDPGSSCRPMCLS